MPLAFSSSSSSLLSSSSSEEEEADWLDEAKVLSKKVLDGTVDYVVKRFVDAVVWFCSQTCCYDMFGFGVNASSLEPGNDFFLDEG